MNKRLQAKRLEIKAATEEAIELSDEVAEYREQSRHNGGANEQSLGALKHAESKMQLEDAASRLQLAYEQHGVDSDAFKGSLAAYLSLKNIWHKWLAEYRQDVVSELYLEMTDPDNRNGNSIYRFRGVRADNTPVPVVHFINAIFARFMAAKNRKHGDYEVAHFRLVDDGDTQSTAPIGDARMTPVGFVRVGQLDELREHLPVREEEMRVPALADLRSFGLKGQQFADDFGNKSDVQLCVVALLRQDADLTGEELVEKLKTTRFTLMDGGQPLKVIEPMEITLRTAQRIKKKFFDGLRDIATQTMRQKYPAANLGDAAVLSDRLYRSLGARAK